MREVKELLAKGGPEGSLCYLVETQLTLIIPSVTAFEKEVTWRERVTLVEHLCRFALSTATYLRVRKDHLHS